MNRRNSNKARDFFYMMAGAACGLWAIYTIVDMGWKLGGFLVGW